MWWPSVSLISLKWSRSMRRTATWRSVDHDLARASSTQRPNSRRLGSAVRASWSAWCSFSTASSRSRSTSRPFSSETLAWLARVSNSLRSSASKVLTSPRRSVTVTTPMTPSSPLRGTAMASLCPAAETWRPASWRSPRPTSDGLAPERRRPPRHGEPGRLGGALDVAVGAEPHPEGVPPRTRQADLGGVGPQQVPGLEQHGAQHRLGLDRPADGAGEPVEQLEAGVALGQRRVGAVGEEEDGGEDDEEAGGPHVAVEHDDGHQSEAGVGAHGHRPGDDHLVEHAPVEGPLVEGHRERDGEGAQQVAHQHGGEGGGPPPGLGREGVAQDQAVDDDGEGRLEGERGEVEGQLHAPLTPVQDERGPGPEEAGRHEDPRERTGQAEHEGDLAQRERVGVTAELEVDDVDLGPGEQRGQDPPGEPQVAGREGQGDDPDHEDHGGAGGQESSQEPDPGGAREAGPPLGARRGGRHGVSHRLFPYRHHPRAS